MSDDPRQWPRKRLPPDISSFAWLLPPLLAAVVALIILFRDPQVPTSGPPEIVHHSTAGAMVYMAGPAASSGSGKPVPVSVQSRQKVFENLRNFRAVYKQAGVQMTVVPVGGGSQVELARRLGSALSQNGLGRVNSAPGAVESNRGVGDGSSPAVLLYCAQRDSEIARELLAALEPYLAGPVGLVWDDALRVDQFRLEIRREPRFAEDGEALIQPG